MLDQASDDLKRSLAEKGVNLLSLEVSTSSGDQRDDQAELQRVRRGLRRADRPGRQPPHAFVS